MMTFDHLERMTRTLRTSHIYGTAGAGLERFTPAKVPKGFMGGTSENEIKTLAVDHSYIVT